MVVNIVCMKWGVAYGALDVNTLYSMVKRHMDRPFRFVCLTDDPSGFFSAIDALPIPSIVVPPQKAHQPWRKLGMFRRGIGDLAGTALFMDLDVVVTGGLGPLFDLPGRFYIIENWTQPGTGIGNSSVFRFEVGAYPEIFDEFSSNAERIVQQFDSEQAFLSRRVPDLMFWPADWVKSFKRHCLRPFPLNFMFAPKMPEAARIIAFHGNPKPADAAIGRWPGAHPLNIKKHIRPTPWVAEHWR